MLLTSIFGYAFDGRHRVEVDMADPFFEKWLQDQSEGLQEEIRFSLDVSDESEALEPSHTHVLVGKFAVNNWKSHPIQLCVEGVHSFLEAPFSVLLEDAISDRDFLLKMLTSQERESILRKLDRGFLRIEHGGGLSNMRRRVDEYARNGWSRHVLCVIFDSDALQPNKPSTESEELRAACADLPHYQLTRRYAESYLPTAALNSWAAKGHNRDVRTDRFARVRAFLRMRDEQRHHFNMKRGFEQDAKRTDSSAGSLYDDVADQDKTILAKGFSSDIRKLFSEDSVTEEGLRRDSGWLELRPIVLRLLAQLR